MSVLQQEAEGSYAFNVYWKLKGNKQGVNASYIAGSVFKLLRLLEQAEGVTRENVDTLVIHQHTGKNTTREVLAIESAVEPSKPHIALTSEPKVEKSKTVTQGFYTAGPAVSLKEE